VRRSWKSTTRTYHPCLPASPDMSTTDGSTTVDNKWFAFVIDEIGTGRQISAAATLAYHQVGWPSAPLIAPQVAATAAAHYERAWWPAKITDSALPHFAVAIRPAWSAELFGEPATLTTRRTELALGREQVCYRSGHNSTCNTLAESSGT
jgi:hypothetical protein